jgi:Sulfotransferase domain
MIGDTRDGEMSATDSNWMKLARFGRALTGRQMAGRNLTVFDDDVFLVSYPRSGNTWTRFLIGNLVSPDPITFDNIECQIPEIYFHPDRFLRRRPRPRILKSHECFQPRYKRVIYILRDPRDVAVSNYHHNLKAGNIPDDYPLDEFVQGFLQAEFDKPFGSWADHVASWIYLREHDPGFLLLRYEEMKKDAPAELMRIARFLEQCSFRQIELEPERLARTIELSSPDRMRALEKQQAHTWVVTRHTRADKPFIRTAAAGGWKSTLSPAAVAKIESAWGGLMFRLGYPLTTVSGDRRRLEDTATTAKPI